MGGQTDYGKGSIYRKVDRVKWEIGWLRVFGNKCKKCNGIGKVMNEICKNCNGLGYTEQKVNRC